MINFLKKAKNNSENSVYSENSFYTNNGASVGTHIAFITSFITHTEPLIHSDRRLQFLLLKDIAGKGMSLSEK